jgi:hypothetical protein
MSLLRRGKALANDRPPYRAQFESFLLTKASWVVLRTRFMSVTERLKLPVHRALAQWMNERLRWIMSIMKGFRCKSNSFFRSARSAAQLRRHPSLHSQRCKRPGYTVSIDMREVRLTAAAAALIENLCEVNALARGELADLFAATEAIGDDHGHRPRRMHGRHQPQVGDGL